MRARRKGIKKIAKKNIFAVTPISSFVPIYIKEVNATRYTDYYFLICKASLFVSMRYVLSLIILFFSLSINGQGLIDLDQIVRAFIGGQPAADYLPLTDTLGVQRYVHKNAAGINVNDADSLTSNELITNFSLSNVTLEITEGGATRTVMLDTFLQDVDLFALIGDSLSFSLTGSAQIHTVSLSELRYDDTELRDSLAAHRNELHPLPSFSTDADTMEFSSTFNGVESITDVEIIYDGYLIGVGGGSGTDDQILSRSGDTLSIEDGNFVLLDDLSFSTLIDEQFISGVTMNVAHALPVDKSKYQVYAGGTLLTEVTGAPFHPQQYQRSGTEQSPVFTFYDPQNAFNETVFIYSNN